MKYFCFVVVLLSQFNIVLANGIQVQGEVKNNQGEPLAFANVFFPDDLSGGITDEAGRFQFTTKNPGRRELSVSYIGYEKKMQWVEVHPDGVRDVVIELQESAVSMRKVTVQASSFSIAEEEGVTFRALDVVTTAGAAADIMRAVQTFAGVTTVDDGAGLFVRGGDVSETTVLLDGGLLKHPYKYESTSGGYFGMFSPFLLSGTFFSGGGFSAKYGNTLSGILAMESLDLPSNRSVEFGMGLAATSLAFNLPLVQDKLGVRFSGNHSTTGTLFRLNGGYDKFSRHPFSDDTNVSLHYKYNKGGIKAFLFKTRNGLGVEAISPTFQGFYDAREVNDYAAVNWKHAASQKMFLSSTLSMNMFQNDQVLGSMDLESEDRTINFRSDLEYHLADEFLLTAGVNAQQLKTTYVGSVPYDWNDIEGDGTVLNFDETTWSNVTGAYAETELRLSDRLGVMVGYRTDYQHQQKHATFDGRYSVVYQLNPDHLMRFATGTYHQFPSAYYYDADNGNPDLKPFRARHYIAGWEYLKDNLMLRAEGYWKKYSDLILEDNQVRYSNAGHGYARGIDLFIKKDRGLLSGWATYSFLQAKRKQLLYHELVPADFDITHHFKVASKFNFSNIWGVNLTYRYSTGRPYHTGYEEWNAGRGPGYQSLDMTLTRLISFFSRDFTVLYVAFGNLLGTRNITRYTYSPDYSDVYAQKSYQTRTVYFGFSCSVD